METITDKKEVNRFFWKVKKELEKKNSRHKLIRVGTARWGNALTMEMQTVDNIYAFCMESCGRPLIINKMKLFNGEGKVVEYIANSFYSHTNISSSTEEYIQYVIIDNLPVQVTITGQKFCNPLTMEHLYNGKEQDIKNLIKANLLSQNFDDSFAGIYSVSNGEEDKVISGVKRENSAIEMLVGKSAAQMTCMADDEIKNKLKEIKSINEKEIWAKYKDNGYYSKVLKNNYRRIRYAFSDYYPAFDYEYIQKMDIEIPKQEYDLGVFGLGSAGSAILDQVCRSNWIKTIYLCDFDEIEEKNLINQWYGHNDLYQHKVTASYDKIKQMERRNNEKIRQIFSVKYDAKKFQDTDYENMIFKYVVSGFDSIKVRLEFFNEIKKGKLKAQYLIDCRYLDLAGSVYIIDTSNKEEMDFYEANLNADGELLNQEEEQKQMMSKEDLKAWLKSKNTFVDNCSYIEREYFKNCVNTCGGACGGDACVDCFYRAYEKLYPIKGIDYEVEKPEKENTCIKQNYIDIYKYVGAIVFGAMRNIQNQSEKPFTLLEAQTNVKGLPNYMIVKA